MAPWARALLLLVGVGLAARGWAAEPTAVRGSNPALAQAIAEAELQSPTFRRLVAEIGQRGGLVYVHHGVCGRNVRACLVLNITHAGPFRVMSVRVDKRKQGRALLIAIGHVLQHVLEVLNEPGAVDADSIRIFYQRTAPTERLSFETQAAIETELTIDAELRRYAGAMR